MHHKERQREVGEESLVRISLFVSFPNLLQLLDQPYESVQDSISLPETVVKGRLLAVTTKKILIYSQANWNSRDKCISKLTQYITLFSMFFFHELFETFFISLEIQYLWEKVWLNVCLHVDLAMHELRTSSGGNIWKCLRFSL